MPALADGRVHSGELAAAAGIHPRYAREWLEQQTVTGFVACDDRTEPARAIAATRCRRATRSRLLDQDSPRSWHRWRWRAVGIAGVLPQLLDAYRTGGGVPYAAYGTDFRDGQAGFNRPAFTNLLADAWLAGALPDAARPSDAAASRVRIADVACGAGWSSIALAKAYPERARSRASTSTRRRSPTPGATRRRAGVADRVTFEVARRRRPARAARTTWCAIFEAVHDMSRPVEVLQQLRRDACADGGSVLVMDERAADSSPRATARSRRSSTAPRCCTACRSAWPSSRRPAPAR